MRYEFKELQVCILLCRHLCKYFCRIILCHMHTYHRKCQLRLLVQFLITWMDLFGKTKANLDFKLLLIMKKQHKLYETKMLQGRSVP